MGGHGILTVYGKTSQLRHAWNTGWTHLLCAFGQRQRETAIVGQSTHEVIAELECLKRRKILAEGKHVIICKGIREPKCETGDRLQMWEKRAENSRGN